MTYLKVLMLEDSPSDASLCLATLQRAGYHVHADVVSTYAEFSQHLDHRDYDIILADYQLPTWTGLKALELLDERGRQTPLIVVTAYYCEETARQVIATGSGGYLLKSQLSQLPAAICRVLQKQYLPAEKENLLAQLRQAAEELGRLNGLLLEPLMLSRS